jgi:hypothetical protein
MKYCCYCGKTLKEVIMLKRKITVKCPECKAIYNKFVNSGFVECGCGEWVSDEHEINKEVRCE